VLHRIDELDAAHTATAVRSVLAVAPDAEEQASASDRDREGGLVRGPLHGVPVMVKDNIEAVGLPCTAGSLALAGHPPTTDAPLVTRLRDAGALIVAATNLSEWANIRSAQSSSGWSAVGGLTRNPWSLDRSAGGSSSGSGAAVAAGLTRFAVGTETDGSIVCPAALNGVVGIKPTTGSVPAAGVVPISHSQDVPGPMARTVDDAELLLSVLANRADLLRASRSVAVDGLHVGVAEVWFTGHAGTDGLFQNVASRIGRLVAGMSAAAVPPTPTDVQGDEFTVLMCELHDDLAAYLAHRRVPGINSLHDVIAFNEANADRELQHFGQELFHAAAATGGCAGGTHAPARARALDWAVHQCFKPAFEQHDLLISPVYAPAWKTDFATGHPSAGGDVTSPAAIAGYPIMSLPMGLVGGLPVGLAIVGPPNSEATMLALARAVEQELALVTDPAWGPTFTTLPDA
jgi:amidase